MNPLCVKLRRLIIVLRNQKKSTMFEDQRMVRREAEFVGSGKHVAI